MEYNIFIDDNFLPHEIVNLPHIPIENRILYRQNDWFIIKSYEDFILIINEKGLPNIISFDHDLTEEHWNYSFNDDNWFNESAFIDYTIFSSKTGYHILQWLILYCIENKKLLPQCIVHSQNYIGRNNIEKLLSIIKKIEEISKLNDNWDGYDGIKTLPEIINKAKKFILNLPNKYVNLLNEDNINPFPHGTLYIEWINDYNLLSIEFGKTSSSYLVVSNNLTLSKDNINDIDDEFYQNLDNIYLDSSL